VIRQVTRDSMVYVNTSSESMSGETRKPILDIRDWYKYRKINISKISNSSQSLIEESINW